MNHTATPLRYESYLELGQLLSSQRPLSSSNPASDLWAGEHYFIVTHQVIELLFKQALVDLSDAARALRDGAWDDGVERVRRVTGVFEGVRSALNTLGECLPREVFLAFRPALGGMSGIQSAQYRSIREHLGLTEGAERGLAAAYRTVVETRSSDPSPLSRRRLVAAMDELARAWEDVWSVHLTVASDYLGDAEGTGGTSGVHYLRALGPQRPFATIDRDG